MANGLTRRSVVKKSKNWKGRKRRSGVRDVDELIGMDMNCEAFVSNLNTNKTVPNIEEALNNQVDNQT